MSNMTRQFFGTLIFLVLTIAGMALFLEFFAPSRHQEQTAASGDYTTVAMRSSMSPDQVQGELDSILALGSRYAGQPGYYATAERIRTTYEAAGLEVFVRNDEVVAPRTLSRRVLNSGGVPLEVEVYPFQPNHIQPTVTSAVEGGVVGELVLLTSESLLARTSFEGAIGVLSADELPRGYGLSWVRFAQLGLSGLILTHPEGLDHIEWEKILDAGGMMSGLPVNFPRLAADPGILDHIGETIRLDVDTRFSQVPYETFIGVLRGKEAVEGAVIVPVNYDAFSILNDLAPGALQAVPLATHLALVKGMESYRGSLRRDVIFMAFGARFMGVYDETRLLQLLNPMSARSAAAGRVEASIAIHKERVKVLEEALGFVSSNIGKFSERSVADTALAALPEEVVRTLQEQFTFVLNTRVFHLQLPVLRAKVDLDIAGEQDKEIFDTYLAALRRSNEATANAAFRIGRFVETRGIGIRNEEEKRQRVLEEVDGVLESLRARLQELLAFHTQREERLQNDLELSRLLTGYEDIVVFSPALLPSPQEGAAKISSLFGDSYGGVNADTRALTPAITRLARELLRDESLSATASWQPGDQVTNTVAIQWTRSLPLGVQQWSAFGYPAFALVNTDRGDSYLFQQSPVVLPWMTDLAPMEGSLLLTGDMLLALAHGYGAFSSLIRPQPYTFTGTVLVSEVGASIIPNYPLPGAYVTHKYQPGWHKLMPGVFRIPILQCDPYGNYEWVNTPITLTTGSGIGGPWLPGGYSPVAFWIGESGLVEVIKDEGTLGQKRYRSTGLPGDQRDHTNVNIVSFRASPVGLMDLINPQTLRLFQDSQLVRTQGLTAPTSQISFMDDEAVVHFAPPDFRFFTTFLSGSLENELVRTVRAFILGLPDPSRSATPLNGLGYFPIDTPILEEIPRKTAESMFRVNQERLAMQIRTGMADEPTVAFQEQSERLLEESRAPGLSRHLRVLLERASTTYAMFVQPVLQNNINAAIISILWYLGLLVPFIVFFEKLVFGFADIRKQLAAQGIIFLIVFALLRVLHPAFELISSSLMILLGFVILIFSTGVMFLFSGKFKENLEGLQARRGQISAAKVNTIGVMGTAFGLGLNNMHRRKVRTGLTCATLVLITFALICFTSIYSDFNDTEVAVGPAPYQGLLVKRESFAPLNSAEIFALRMKYGHEYPVAAREVWVGIRTQEREVFNPNFEATYTPEGGITQAVSLSSVLHFSPDEPLRDQIPLLTSPWWFAHTEAETPEQRIFTNPAVFIPDVMADRFGILPEMVDGDEVVVQINGQPFSVSGIFDSAKLGALTDLDGYNLLPFDILALASPRASGTDILADSSDHRISAEQVVLVQEGVPLTTTRGSRRLVSAAIDLGELSYRDAREVVVGFLEQSGVPGYYGLEDLAFFGSRLRQSSFRGLVDMIIPLIIAAVTVLNTMRGSVYERKDEIYVYNAVGIAPKFVFFIFVAESLVYAVVGSMLGYLLSQGTGKVLTLLDLTGGLNMTFASMTSVYASLAVFVAVLASSWIPARTAMKIAEPAEDSGWKLPEPEGDEISFQLPFTFDKPDRIAVLILFERYLLDHGEGGSGRFSADVPVFGIKADVDGSLMPAISCSVWLKPFDLAVSQKLLIEMPRDPESGEFIAKVRLIRLSGTTESWNRLNVDFVAQVRQQFLHWRAVSAEQRSEFYREAKAKLEENLKSGKGSVNA